MKQVLRKGLKDIVVAEVPVPRPEAHHMLVRPLYSLISSGTETASIHQEGVLKEVAENPSHLSKVWNAAKQNGPVRTAAEVRAKFSEYAVLGYAGAGLVVERHPTVVGFQDGDLVAYGGEGTGHAEVVSVARNLVAAVPETVPPQQACFTTLGSIALNAVRIGEVGLGDVVAVIGLGLVGQLIAQLVRLQGGVVIAVDLRPERVELARQLGAQHGVARGADPLATVAALTDGKGADTVMVAAAAKSAAPALQGLRLCRDRGRLVVVGAVGLDLPWHEMYMKEIKLFMSRAYGPGSYDVAYERQGQDYPYAYVRWTEQRNMAEFLRLLTARQVLVDPLVTHEYPLEEAHTAYQTIMDPASRSLAVLLRYPAPASTTAGPTPAERRVVVQPPGKTRDTLGFALVGAGNLARWAHLPNLRKIEHARLHAVLSASGARGRTYAERFGASYCSTDYDTILQDDAVDAVLIVSRNQHHFPQAMAALEAGKHVFVEKPMALTAEECRTLYHQVADSGRQLTVGFNRRFSPFYQKQREALANRSGPAVLNIRVNSPGISGQYWMADPSIGGAIIGEAVHFADLAWWLLQSEPRSISAHSLPTGRKDPIGENNLAASLAFQDGSIANLTYCTVGSASSGGERVEVFAPGVGAVVDEFRRFEARGRVRRRRSRIWPDKGYRHLLENFVDAIRQGRPPAITARDGARATLVCLAMLEAARSEQPVSFDLDRILES